MHTQRLPLGELLLQKGLITKDQLQIALLEQGREATPGHPRLGEVLVELGFLSNGMLRTAMAESLGQTAIDLNHSVADSRALQMVNREFAWQHQVFPVAYTPSTQTLAVAMANPNNLLILDQLRIALRNQVTIQPLVAAAGEIRAAIERFYAHDFSIEGILREIENGELNLQARELEAGEYRQPVVRLVDAILAEAVRQQASDIHFEPEPAFLRVRYRIDGVLRQVRSLHKNYWSALLVRLKIISGMNIAETRAPQDGRSTLNLAGRSIDFRASSQPTLHGENFVLRILDRQRAIVPLEQLGLSATALYTIKLMLARPEGLILLTGPTGSGKTTTLYSILTHISNEGVNIMTLEDPVEYPLPWIRQTSLGDHLKLDFASGVRALLRQDPDIILVGEIRDQDSASMALRAAMTGHQVFSTLHSNSAAGALPRLLDIGVLPEILASNLIGIIAQRLVRKLCLHCRTPYTPSPTEKKLLGSASETDDPVPLYTHQGCAECSFTGYRGRIAILEILRISPALEALIAQRATTQQFIQAAQAEGWSSLAEDAVRRVLDGTTALAEITRVVDLTARL